VFKPEFFKNENDAIAMIRGLIRELYGLVPKGCLYENTRTPTYLIDMKNDPMYIRLIEFLSFNMHEKTGIDFLGYLSLTTYQQAIYKSAVAQVAGSIGAAIDDIENKANKGE
jgi:hypothetical protein